MAYYSQDNNETPANYYSNEVECWNCGEVGHIAKGCAKPKTDVKGQAKGKGKGKGKGRGKGKGKGKGKDKDKEEEEDSTKPRWSFCAISVEEEGAQIENYKKVVKRSGSVNDYTLNIKTPKTTEVKRLPRPRRFFQQMTSSLKDL